MHRPGISLIACPNRITGEAKQIANPKGMRAEEIRLKTDAIPVATGLLKHWLEAGIQQQPT